MDGDVTPQRLRSLPTWLLGQANARAHRELSTALSAAGARGYDYRVLAALAETGPSSQVALGRGAGLDRSDIAQTVDALQSRGAVVRSPDPADARRKVVALTPAGRRLLRRLDAVLADVQDRVLAPLTASERVSLVALLERLQP